jgi:tmRNA-binding protein
MSSMETSATELRENTVEIDWRHVWLSNVLIDSGRFGLPKITRYARRVRKLTLSQRLHKLHRMRAALGPPR